MMFGSGICTSAFDRASTFSASTRPRCQVGLYSAVAQTQTVGELDANGSLVVVNSFPFHRGRSVSFTNAKLLERREAAERRSGSTERELFTLLPTSYLVINLAVSEGDDRQFAEDALDLPRLDKMVIEARDSPMLQQLSVKAKVRCSELSQRSL